MQTVHLDKIKLKQVTHSSKTATATMILLGMRQRARSHTNLAKIKSQLLEMNEKIVDRDYMDFWRGLEATGAGSIILGRRGKQSRFEWNYSLIEIAKIAIEDKKEEIKKVDFKFSKKPQAPNVIEAVVEAKDIVEASGPNKQEKLVYSIPVRPGYTLEVNLPSDLSSDELQKIKDSFVLPKNTK